MKKIFFILVSVSLLFSHHLFAQRSGSNNDSLLFDGSEAVRITIPIKTADEWCHGKITYQHGDVQFQTTEKEIVNRSACLDHLPDDTVLSTKWRNKQPGDYIHTGDEIQTGANGRAEVQ